jgi:hypothetical protein
VTAAEEVEEVVMVDVSVEEKDPMVEEEVMVDAGIWPAEPR